MRSVDAPLVLLASDDAQAAPALAAALRAEGLEVIVCRRAGNAIDAVSFHRPSVVLVDVALDADRGWDVVAAARAHGDLPTLVIQRDDDVAGCRAAYAAGADGIVAGTFDPADVARRAHALARRAQPKLREGRLLRHRDLVMDVEAHQVRIAGRAVELTALQFAIVRVLLESAGAALDRAQLVARTASFDDEAPSDRAIDLHVSKIRARLGDDARQPRYIEAVYGVGYRLATGDVEAGDLLGGAAFELLEALPDPMLVVDVGLTVRFANRAAERLLGAKRASIVGRRCGDLLACRSCAGASLDGPRCFGHAVLGGLGVLRDAPAEVRGPDGPVPVAFSYGRAEVAHGEVLMTITIRPRQPDRTV